MTGLVLDTSAILAALFQEAGEASVRDALASGTPLMSAVNVAETVGQLVRRKGWPALAALGHLRALGLTIVPFDANEAAEVGRLEALLLRRGISFADRACLASAGLRRVPVLTADRAWAALGLDVEVRLIR